MKTLKVNILLNIIGCDSTIGNNTNLIIYFIYCAPLELENLTTKVRQKKISQNPNGVSMWAFVVHASFESLSLGAREACQYAS